MILTDLGVFNFCTFHLKEKWTTMLQVERRLAVRQARFESRLGTPGRFPNEPTAMKKMEIVMKIVKKCLEYMFVLHCLFVAKMEK